MQPEFDPPSTTTITAVDSITVAPSGPTLVVGTVVGTDVFVKISGGTAGTRYLLDAKITLSDGTKLEGAGVLSVVDPVLPTT